MPTAQYEPWQNRRGFDSLVQRSSGVAMEKSGIVTALPYQALDHSTGYLTAATVMQALRLQHAGGGAASTIYRWRDRLRFYWMLTLTTPPCLKGSLIKMALVFMRIIVTMNKPIECQYLGCLCLMKLKA
ncbi:hypothetical protein [Marinomonas sp. GJ51-6]|uniref:hypothetical protein n=1 Tax=Marinomonas sp. GJ51-6 TaxID=2992802 RepID=UPI0029352F94|nr:hypothetical protein [Marinomonas sp. GJ51-6]WOD09247.1 hypothetical protein ONZ50_09620 [Marinomonas sp. GJ51-6]